MPRAAMQRRDEGGVIMAGSAEVHGDTMGRPDTPVSWRPRPSHSFGTPPFTVRAHCSNSGLTFASRQVGQMPWLNREFVWRET